MTALSRPPGPLRVDPHAAPAERASSGDVEVRVRAIDEVQLLGQIRREFLEMPGLNLTLAQAQRLWGLDRLTCEHLCNRLIDEGFLQRTSRGEYVLRSVVRTS